MTLAVRAFPHPHSAERVRDLVNEILKEWDIDQKVHLIVTDNGSNMVKAFRNDMLSHIATDEECLSDDEESESDTEDEASYVDVERDFDLKELQHDMAFAHFGKHLGCFAHSLQLVVLNFKGESLKPLMKKVHGLVKKINKSSRATGMLLPLCGKKACEQCSLSVELYFSNDRSTPRCEGSTK